MKELQYPFDALQVLQKKRSLKKRLLGESTEFVEKKIALLSGSTIGEVKNMLELFLLAQGIRPVFFEGDYNRFYEDVLFDNPELVEFAPDFIYLHTSNKNIEQWPDVGDSKEVVAQKLENELGKYRALWQKMKATYHCPMIQNNFDLPSFRIFGNSDGYRESGRVQFVNRLNAAFAETAENGEYQLYLNDIHYLSSWIGLEKWDDPNYWYSYKYAMSMEAIPHLAFQVANIVKSLLGKNKKALVLDLDNTLWGGVIGDDGPENIGLGMETPRGMAFTAFQAYLKQLMGMGILLNVNSKNEETIALTGFNHPGARLKREDFIEFYANWEGKHENMQKIASALNLMLDSCVFVDDNPVERDSMRGFLPQVEVPEMGQPEDYIRLISHSGFFESTVFSTDDSKRVTFYQDNLQRKQMESSFSDYNEYLISLEMESTLRPFETETIERVTQLINKTNQFNMTTRRYTETEIATVVGDPTYYTLCANLLDKFGENGIITAVIAEKKNMVLSIDLWVMSCRVFKRHMEYAVFDALVTFCKENGIMYIEGLFKATKKNMPVAKFYEELGFVRIADQEDGASLWQYEIPSEYQNKNNEIKVKNND